MPRVFKTIAFPGEMILLGTGTSVGVPTIGCGCAVCTSQDPRNNRTRCSAIVGLPDGNLLIDTSPDLRTQLLREGIGMVHAVIFTHEHVDHLYGLDDLRLFPFALGHSVPLYCERRVEDRIRHAFDYAFHAIEQTHVGAVPQLEIRPIGLEPIEILGQSIQPVRLFHGPRFEVLGFRIGNVAYCTDTNGLPNKTIDLLQGLDVLVLDALRTDPHPTHFSIDEAMAMADKLGAKQTYFTHVSHEFDFESTNRRLPANRQLAFDGQRIRLT
jgi:phosphoribosyl 1,2-cyclic phosphate phosphodiesterase